MNEGTGAAAASVSSGRRGGRPEGRGGRRVFFPPPSQPASSVTLVACLTRPRVRRHRRAGATPGQRQCVEREPPRVFLFGNARRRVPVRPCGPWWTRPGAPTTMPRLVRAFLSDALARGEGVGVGSGGLGGLPQVEKEQRRRDKRLFIGSPHASPFSRAAAAQRPTTAHAALVAREGAHAPRTNGPAGVECVLSVLEGVEERTTQKRE